MAARMAVGLLAEARSHFKEDAVDLALFIFEQADEFIVLLDGFQRLDEDGLAAGAGPVDNTMDATFLLGLDGNDEAVASDGDQLVLQRVAFREAAQIAAQRVLDGAALLFDLPANGGQGGRGVVIESSVRREFVGEIAKQRREILDGCAELLDGGPGLTHCLRRMRGGFAPLGSAVNEEDDVAKLGGLQRGSADAGAENKLGGSTRPPKSKRPPARKKARTSAVSCCWRSIQAASVVGASASTACRPSSLWQQPRTISRRRSNSSTAALV